MLEERVHLLDTPDAAENLMPILSPLLIGFLVSSSETVQTSISMIGLYHSVPTRFEATAGFLADEVLGA